jgi:hypothetical protein
MKFISNRRRIGLGGVALFVLASLPLHAQPANDAFADSRLLSGSSGSVTQSTVGATREAGEPMHAGNTGGASVWFAWEAPANGAAEFDLHSSGFNTVMGAYTGLTLQSLVAVAANDDAFDYAPLASRWLLRGTRSHLRFPARAGVRYHLAVDGAGGIAGDLKLVWRLQPPPPNDDFTSARVITGLDGFLQTHNVGATREAAEPSHAGNNGSASIWFRWTAPASGPTRFHTLNSLTSSGSPLDTLLAVYAGDHPDALTPVAANDNNGASLRSLVQFTATAGATYHIAVDTKPAATNQGDVLLTWANGAPPNDNFANAQLLTGVCGLVQGHNISATKESGERTITGNAGGASIWYSWTAPEDGQALFTTQGSPFLDTLLAVYTGGSVSALTLVAENDDIAVGYVDGLSYSRVEFEATAGATYRIAIDGYRSGATAASGVTFLHWAFEPAANNDFFNAQPLPGTSGVVTACTAFASKEFREPDHAGNNGGSSLWYQWEAPASGVAIIDLNGSRLDSLLAVYQTNVIPAVDQLTLVAQNDDAFDGFNLALHSRVEFPVAANATYYIAVDGASDGAGYFSDGWLVMRYDFFPVPVLQFTRAGGSLIIDWNGPYTLESTSALDAAWTPVPGPPPVSVPITATGSRFFRAIHP